MVTGNFSDKTWFPSAFSSLHFFFHGISSAAENHSWPSQFFWYKIFSHFSIPGLFSPPLLAGPFLCFPLSKLKTLQTSFPPPSLGGLRQCLMWGDSPRTRSESPCVVSRVWALLPELAHLSGFLGGVSLIFSPLTSHSLITLPFIALCIFLVKAISMCFAFACLYVSLMAKIYFQTYFLLTEYSENVASGILSYRLFSAHCLLWNVANFCSIWGLPQPQIISAAFSKSRETLIPWRCFPGASHVSLYFY